jgi:NitT/TauT family transport system substrate-binding protein
MFISVHKQKSRRREDDMFRFAWIAAALAGFAGSAAAQDLPRLTLATQAAGTVNWEIRTILDHGLDRANGFALEVMEVAGSPAAQVAFLGGEADVIVSDWIWVARQRAEGQDLTLIPYSKAVGGAMVPADSPAETLADLRGMQIGVAGGPVDKSWIVLRALALEEGFDLAAETTQVFGAPPIVMKAALDGEVGAVVNFWHLMAKQEAAGMRHLISVAQAAEALGLDPDVPLLGYVLRGETLRETPELARGLAAASRAAKDLLVADDAEWERLRPIMGAESEAEFVALREGWRAGVPEPGPVDEAEVARLLALMAELGGAELVGAATELPEGVFAPVGY